MLLVNLFLQATPSMQQSSGGAYQSIGHDVCSKSDVFATLSTLADNCCAILGITEVPTFVIEGRHDNTHALDRS